MHKYTRVERKKEEDEETQIGENEIRVTQKGKVGGYISYGHRIFEEKENKTVILKALGNAISKCITVAEILKRTTAGLHQITQIGSMETIDVYEPIEEGLDVVKTTRHLPTIMVTLSMNQLDKNDLGYQEPLPESMLRPTTSSFSTRGGNGGGRGRGSGASGRGGDRGRRDGTTYGRGRGRNERSQAENKEDSTEEEEQHQKHPKEEEVEEDQEENGEGSDEAKNNGAVRGGRGGRGRGFRGGRGRGGRGRGGRGRGAARGRGAYSNRRDEERT